jgi:CheY-like chemotaxis protein
MSLHPTPRNTVSGTHATSLSLPSSALDASSESQRKPRVLLVDDNDINIRLLETFMKKRKALVLDTAENGRAAVDFFEQTSQGYDLIFMDISMPIMNGFEATSAIRAIEKERDCCVRAKIIAFTGLSSLHDESRAKDSGVDLFLTKPVSFKEVSRLVDEWETEHST